MINARKISIIHVGGLRPTDSSFASHFGLTPLGLPDEKWPTFFGPQGLSSGSRDQEPKNLFFLCQLNLTEAPYVSEILSDIKLITIFVHPEFVDSEYICIRAYKSLEGLIPINVPEGATFNKGYEVNFELAEDNPQSSDPDLVFPEDVDDPSSNGFDEIVDKFEHKYCSKIGGYASSIQDPPFTYEDEQARPKFCLQIDSEDKIGLMWGDSGTFYLARGTSKGYEDQFFGEIQFF